MRPHTTIAISTASLDKFRAEFAPASLLVLARTSFGDLVAAVALPPSERLRGTVSSFVQAQLLSARASATGGGVSAVKAAGKVAALQWAVDLAQEGGAGVATKQGTGPASCVAVTATAADGTEVELEVEVVKATEVARLLEACDPRWLSGPPHSLHT